MDKINDLEKDRNKKQKEELKNAIKLVKLQADIRKNNEEQRDRKLGIDKSLTEFHKPVTKKLEEQDKSRKENIKAINDKLDELNISLQPIAESSRIIPEAIEDVKELYKEPSLTYNVDQYLDTDYLISEKLYKPSKLLDNKEKLDEMYAKAKELKEKLSKKKGNLQSTIIRAVNLSEEELSQKKDELDAVKYKEVELQKYLGRLTTIRGSEVMKVGKGLDLLSELIDKRCQGSKSKKLKNEVKLLIDKLIKAKKITNGDKERLYNQFLL